MLVSFIKLDNTGGILSEKLSPISDEKNHFEDELDYDKAQRKAIQMLVEIDKAGFSSLTQDIKSRFLKKGEVKPSRLNQFIKEGNRLYYDEFLQLMKLRNEKTENKELNANERNYYLIALEQRGYYGLGYMEFYRGGGKKTWFTSEYGTGYTTTCNSIPKWLEIKVIGNGKGYNKEDDAMHYSNISEYKALLNNQFLVGVIYEYRFHENGDCGHYIFKFKNVEDADKFSQFLMEKENEMTPDDKLKYLHHDPNERGYLFDYDELRLIDSQYTFLNCYSGNEIEKLILEADGKLDYAAIREADRKFKDDLNNQLLEISQKSKSYDKRKKEFPNFDLYKEKFPKNNKRDYYKFLQEASYEVITWKMLEKLLQNFKKDIIKLAKEYYLENMNVK